MIMYIKVAICFAPLELAGELHDAETFKSHVEKDICVMEKLVF